MKRFLLALLFACLLPAQVLALDISPYALSVKGEDCWDLDLIALSQDDHWQRNHEPALERYQQGVCTYRLALPKGEGSYLPLLGEDGRMRLLARRSAGLTWQQKSYALHEIEGGALSGARSFEGAPYQVEPLGDGFAGVCADGDSASLLLCYDADMQVIATYAFPFAHAQIQATAQSGGKLYLLVAQGGYPHLPDDYVLRLEGGALEPVYRDASAKGSYNRMMPDGQGGVLLTGSLESDYKNRASRGSAQTAASPFPRRSP